MNFQQRTTHSNVLFLALFNILWEVFSQRFYDLLEQVSHAKRRLIALGVLCSAEYKLIWIMAFSLTMRSFQ